MNFSSPRRDRFRPDFTSMAYIFPAVTKTLQSAGRCIRSETDRGVVVFLEERYAWPKYRKCFPPDWHLQIVKDCENPIKIFFES